jgi:hypothetical protein
MLVFQTLWPDWAGRLYLNCRSRLDDNDGATGPATATISDICRLESRVESRADYGLSHDLLEQRMQLGGFDRLLQDGCMGKF